MAHIQQNLNYKAARSTRLLNNHIKDNFGQQRPVVLFGFKVSQGAPSTNNVTLGKGAILTHDGQKIFAYDAIVDTLSLPLSTVPSSDLEMYVVVMKHKYAADTSTNEPLFSIVQVQDWMPRDIEPIKDIREINIINGSVNENSPTLYHSTFNTITEGYNVGGFSDLVYGEDDVLGHDQTPIAKFVINRALLPGSNIVDGSGNWSAGVSVFQYKNPFEQLVEQLGINFFEPANAGTSLSMSEYERWQDTTIDNGENTPFSGSMIKDTVGSTPVNHDYNWPGFYNLNEHRTPVNNPLYGFYSADGTFNRALYQYASFLDDGHSFKWNLQRLSEILRALESVIGGHPETSITRYYQSIAPKDIAEDVSGSSIPCNYNISDSECFIIRNGSVGWYKPPIGDSSTYAITNDFDNLGTFSLGDNHHTAIAMLDRAMSYLWKNRLGLEATTAGFGLDRLELRTFSMNASSTSFDREHWNVTSISGDVGQYSTLKAAIQNIINNKLHRHDGYADGWIHFGTDTASSQSFSKVSKDFYDANSYGIWFDPVYYTLAETTPLHMSNGAVVVKAITYQGDIGVDQAFGGVEFAGNDIAKFSVRYPSVVSISSINSLGQLYRGSGETNEFNRSTKTGYEFLNLSSRKMYDVAVVYTPGPAPTNGTLCTITYESPFLNQFDPNRFRGTVSATVFSNQTSFGKSVVKLVLNDAITMYPIETMVGFGGFSQPIAYDLRFTTPWNLLSLTKYDKESQNISGYSIGMSTITFSNGYSIAIGESFNYNTYESARDFVGYTGNVNIVDSRGGAVSNKLVSDLLSGNPYNNSILPYHFSDWIVVGDGDPKELSRKYNAIKGSIIGDFIQLKGETLVLDFDEIILKSKRTMVPSGSSIRVGGEIKVLNGGKIDALDAGSLIVYNNNLNEIGEQIAFSSLALKSQTTSAIVPLPNSWGRSVSTLTVTPIYGNSNMLSGSLYDTYEGSTQFDSGNWINIISGKSLTTYQSDRYGRDSFQAAAQYQTETASPITIPSINLTQSIGMVGAVIDINVLGGFDRVFTYNKFRSKYFKNLVTESRYTSKVLEFKLSIGAFDFIKTITQSYENPDQRIEVVFGSFAGNYGIGGASSVDFNTTTLNSLVGALRSFSISTTDNSLLSIRRPAGVAIQNFGSEYFSDILIPSFDIRYTIV